MKREDYFYLFVHGWLALHMREKYKDCELERSFIIVILQSKPYENIFIKIEL